MGCLVLNMVGGGAGAAKNFNVLGGTTEPASPTENTIWVNTDQAITGYVFSSASDTPASPSEGIIWFQTSSTAPVGFDAFNNGEIFLYPASAKQYLSGVWTDKTAMIFVNDEWVPWTVYVYDSGDEKSVITGGWVAFNPRYGSGASGCTKNVGNLKVYYANTGAGSDDRWLSGGYGTNEEIDLSSYSTLHLYATTASLSGSNSSNGMWFGVTPLKNTSSYNNGAHTAITSGAGEKTLDISSIDSGYIWFGATVRSTGTYNVVVTSIWLT